MKRTTLKSFGLYGAVALLLIFILFPFLQLLSTSLKHSNDWGNPSLIPQKINLSEYAALLGFTKEKEVDLENLSGTVKALISNPKLTEKQKNEILKKYVTVKETFSFFKYMGNTLFFSLVASLSTLMLSILSAYAISRLNFVGRTPIRRLTLFVYTLGGILLLIPLYQVAVATKLIQVKAGVIFVIILIYIMQTLPVAIYMLGNYYRSIPTSLEEAAMMDGCTRLQALFRVILPLLGPALGTVFIYCFIITWNEYLFASIFLKKLEELHTLPIALKALFVSKNAIWGKISAASIMTLLPPLIVFMFAMKQMTKGMTEGSVKG